MAVKGLFLIGWTKGEILEVLNTAKLAFSEGRAIMSYGEGSTNVNKQFTYPPDLVMLEAQYALQTLFPAEYGTASSQWTRNTYRGMTDY